MNRELAIFKVGQVWHYRYRLDGIRVQRSTKETSRTLAAVVADDAWKAAKLRARGEEPEPTLGVLAALWIESHALILSPARIDSMETFARLHIGTLKGLPLRQLTTIAVEDARVAYLQNHGRESANLWLNCLHALVAWAIRRRMIREVPWQVRPLKVQRKPKVLLPSSKAAQWMATVVQLAAGDPGLLLVVRLMIGLGLRVSEAMGTRWEWLDLERATYTPGETKGREAFSRPVPAWLMDRLRPAAQIMGPIVPLRPGHPITDQRVAYLMDKANKACGVLHVTPHRLRGTYATWLSELGVPIQDIMRALGHKDPRTTMRYLEVDMGRVAMAQISIADRLDMTGRGSGEPISQDAPQTSTSDFYREMPKKGGRP